MFGAISNNSGIEKIMFQVADFNHSFSHHFPKSSPPGMLYNDMKPEYWQLDLKGHRNVSQKMTAKGREVEGFDPVSLLSSG